MCPFNFFCLKLHSLEILQRKNSSFAPHWVTWIKDALLRIEIEEKKVAMGGIWTHNLLVLRHALNCYNRCPTKANLQLWYDFNYSWFWDECRWFLSWATWLKRIGREAGLDAHNQDQTQISVQGCWSLSATKSVIISNTAKNLDTIWLNAFCWSL